MRTLVIGLTGLPSAGKDTAANELRELGFSSYVFSDVIREEARRRDNANPTRDELQSLGDELRAAHGPGVLARRLAERIAHEAPARCYVNGVRHLGEWQELRAHHDLRCVLVAIVADSRVRFDRLRARARPGDPADYRGSASRPCASGRSC